VRNPCRILVRNRLGNMKVDKIYIKIWLRKTGCGLMWLRTGSSCRLLWESQLTFQSCKMYKYFLPLQRISVSWEEQFPLELDIE
jgi:hypothetical protein